MEGFDGIEEGFGLDEHAGAAAEGAVIDSVVWGRGPLTEVVEVDGNKAVFYSAAENALRNEAFDHGGEERDKVDGDGGCHGLALGT